MKTQFYELLLVLVEIELNCPPAEHACRRGVRGALPEARRRLRWWQGHNLALKL